VETDQAFVDIFGRRPDWLGELEGRRHPVRGGIVVLGDRTLFPPGAEEFPHLRILYLDERLKALEESGIRSDRTSASNAI
jgi:hypothetical protein